MNCAGARGWNGLLWVLANGVIFAPKSIRLVGLDRIENAAGWVRPRMKWRSVQGAFLAGLPPCSTKLFSAFIVRPLFLVCNGTKVADGRTETAEVAPGTVQYFDAQVHLPENTGTKPLEVILVELKK